jgi:hypothetical protein
MYAMINSDITYSTTLGKVKLNSWIWLKREAGNFDKKSDAIK